MFWILVISWKDLLLFNYLFSRGSGTSVCLLMMLSFTNDGWMILVYGDGISWLSYFCAELEARYLGISLGDACSQVE